MPLNATARRYGTSARRVMPLVIVLASVAVPRFASGAGPSDRNACARAYEQAQRLRKAHALKAARSELLVCSRAECPAWVRSDCVPWLGAVELAMPSIVVEARTAEGQARSDVRLTVDGTPAADRLTSQPISLDPGEHELVLEAEGVARIEQHLTLREGERERRITVTFAPAVAPPPKADASEPLPERPRPEPEAPPELKRPVPPLVYVLGATGIVATAVGGYFQLSGMSKRSDLQTCAPRCTEGEVDDARRTLWVGNIALGVGVVSLGAALWMYLVRPSVQTGTSALQLDVHGVRSGLVGGLETRF
jgi:hypothetical protein